MRFTLQNPVIRHTGLISLSAVLLATSGISAAWATTVPTSVDPAKIEKRFDQPQNPLPASNLQTPAKPASSELPKKVQAELAKKKFVLKKVIVEGATVYSADQLKFAYEDMIGKQVSLLDAQKVASRITDLYHSHEYILSQAVVPAQDVTGGTLKIRVIEGYISKVTIQGDIKEREGHKIAEGFGENLTHIRPVRTSDLERYLLLIDDLPGASAKGLVRPSATPGAADLIVTMTHKTFEASYTIDNRGTKFVGPWQHSATVTANSIFGMYDRTLLRAITTSPTTELRFIDLQHEEQIGSEGTRFIFDASHSTTKPGDSLRPIEIVADSDFLQGKLLHPFIRSRKENLVGRFIFDYRNTDTDVFRTTNFSEDRLRVVRAGGSFDFADHLLGVDLIDAQVSQGINIFNASKKIDEVSNTKADGTFTKLNLDLTRTQPLPHNFSLYTAASGQYAFQPLLAAEQFTLGGVGFGQAYDPAELSGDHGIAGKAELRYGETVNTPYLTAYQLYGYYDIGRVWSREAGFGGNDKKSLASTGLGLRTNFTEYLSSSLELGVPLTRDATNQGGHGDSPRVFFSATGRF